MRWFFGKFKTSKSNSEINWPLINDFLCSSLAGEMWRLTGLGDDIWVVLAGNPGAEEGGLGGGGINELELGS